MHTLQTLCAQAIASDSIATSGDFFETVPLAINRRIAVAMGNISLPGLAGTILRRGVRSALKSLLSHDREPAAVSAELNRILWDVAPESTFASLFTAHIDPGAETVRYVNAGHEAALLLRAGGAIERLEPHAASLGLSRRSEYRPKAVRFHPGDLLFILSEGAGETAEKILCHRSSFAPRELASQIVDSGNPAQDRTAIVIYGSQQMAAALAA
jgi:sigma-B regulation protein RsbU (phosphoserine phosphatase)